MALTITQEGIEISTEKLILKAVTSDPLVLTVKAYVYVNTLSLAFPSITLEHQPNFGTTDEFSFEINSIVKDYFASEFLPLTGVNQTTVENALVTVVFEERLASGTGANEQASVVIKNITQDTFEIEDFDLANYDCGDTGSITSKLLTSSPNPLLVGDFTSIFVSCLTTSYDGGLNPKQEWVVQTLLNGVLVNTITDPVTVPTRGITGGLTDGKYDISNYRFDFASTDGYDEVRVYIRDIASPFAIRSEQRAYKLNDACEKSITLSWLNEFGVQDTFTFLGNITRTGKYTDSTYKKVRPVNPVSTDVGDLVYKSSYNYQYDIYSDRMPETSVQWLSNILVNKRAAIQESPTLTASANYLYNFFAINNGVEGDGRVSGGIVNNSLSSWRVAQDTDFATLETFLGGNSVAGGKMKEAGFDNWVAPNTGADNSSGFTGLGQGSRSNLGLFFAQYNVCKFWTGNLDGFGNNVRGLDSSNAGLSLGVAPNEQGNSIRLTRPALGGELDGQLIVGAYTGNNGKAYDGVVIGTQVWINRDLEETLFNNGTAIPNITDNTAWSSLTTGAFSFYNNQAILGTKGTNYFPITITTEETVLEDKFTPETLFRLKFRLANKRKGLK